MKKSIYFLALVFFILGSCSSDSESSEGNVVKRMVFKGDGVVYDYKADSFNFIYDNENRLLKINRGNQVHRSYEYSGDVISKINAYVFWNGDATPTLLNIISFEYDSNSRLIKATSRYAESGEISFEYIFSYLGENQVEFQIKIYTWSGDNDLASTGVATYDSETKNILHLAQNYYSSYLLENGELSFQGNNETEFIYDDKLHPCSNIKGFKELALFNYFSYDSDVFTENFGVTNNLIGITTSHTNPGESQTVYTQYLWTYTYGNLFPSKMVKNDNDDFEVHLYY